MHGRSYAGLLAVLLFSASLMLGQSVEPKRDMSSVSDPLTESADVYQHTVPQSIARPTVVAVPALPIIPGSPAPIPQPLPWRGPIFPAPSGFAQLARSAGIIFSGTVTNIQRSAANVPGQAVGTVAITFHVETAIRGATAGKSLTITQWIGLWLSGQRYQIGERLLLFLYPRSRVGLTSCVAAGMGRFAVDSSGIVRLTPQQILAFRTDSVFGGKSHVRLSDFASAVRWASEEE
jgi:hypothetical protein